MNVNEDISYENDGGDRYKASFTRNPGHCRYVQYLFCTYTVCMHIANLGVKSRVDWRLPTDFFV